jgi:hypothetical protein
VALVLENEVYALCAGTIAHASGARVRILSGANQERVVDVEHGAWRLSVSPDGSSVLIYESNVPRVWRWREDHGVDLWAVSRETRDSYGCGFFEMGGEVLTLLAQGGYLRAFTNSGSIRFAASLRSPYSFYPRAFAPLPDERLAIIGHFFGDSSDTVITVGAQELLRDPEAVQTSIRARSPVNDRAVQITAGACAPNSAVVYRNPEGDEEPDQEASEEKDVYGFAGAYIRQLDTGALIERHEFIGSATSYSNITSSDTWIAVQVKGGLDMIERSSGHVRHVPGAVLDSIHNEVAIVSPEGTIQPIALDRLVTSITP